MDYCALGSIRDMMMTLDKPLKENQLKYVILSTLKALIYLHSRVRHCIAAAVFHPLTPS